MKRELLLFVALISICTTVFSQGTAPSNGNGTSEDPYQIEHFDHLLWLSETNSALNKYYIQTADIDATASASLNNGAGFSPIGTFIFNTQERAFTGVYDGNGFYIRNLVINRPDSADYQALFGCIWHGSVMNLNVVDAQISGHFYTGILVGFVQNNSSIIKCTTSGLVNSTGSYVGGLAGAVREIIIDSCFSTVTITATGPEEYEFCVGGLFGDVFCYGSIERSAAEANISANNYYNVGVLIGSCGESTIKSCSATGSVEGRMGVGGFIGNGATCTFDSCFTDASVYSTGSACGGFAGGLSNCDINYSYSFGEVSSTGYGDIGGFVGVSGTLPCNYRQSFSNSKVESTGIDAGGFIGLAWQETTAVNCYATGEVDCANNYAGGFIGYIGISSGIEMVNCYSTGKVSGTIKGGFAGFNKSGTFTDCFWDVESSETTTAIGQNDGDVPQYLNGKTTSEMKDVITYTNLAGEELSEPWDFVGNPYDDDSDEDIWNINPEVNNGYPYLTVVFPPVIPNSIFPFYEINNENQLLAYPNPLISSQKHLNLILKSVIEPGNYTVSFMDIYGRTYLKKGLWIQSNTIHSNETHFSLQLKNNQLKPGVYFIVLMKQRAIISRVKLVVQN